MNGEADVSSIGPKLNRERDLGNQLAGVRADHATPSTRWVAGSNNSLVMPSSRPSESERPLAAHGKAPFSNAIRRLGGSLRQSTQATSGSV